MEFFCENGWKISVVNYFRKSSILDVWLCSEYTSVLFNVILIISIHMQSLVLVVLTKSCCFSQRRVSGSLIENADLTAAYLSYFFEIWQKTWPLKSLHRPTISLCFTFIKQNWGAKSRQNIQFVRGFQQPPLFKAPNPWPSLSPPFLKSLYPSPLFCSILLSGILDSSPHPYTTPSCPNPTNQPSLV